MDRVHSPFNIARKYLHYFLTASNGKGHGIHSPFVYDFVRNVLNADDYPENLEEIELLRKKLKSDRTQVPLQDYGAGNNKPGRTLTVADIATHASKSKKMGRLLYQLARHYRPVRIVEMGTCFGISTAYLAISASGSVVTGEGNDFIAQYAVKNFKALGLSNIQVITGNFNDTLPEMLRNSGQPDFIFFDGNHREDATVQYFESALPWLAPSSVAVFDDIRWSVGMESAWERIKSNRDVMLTIDLFFMGLVFFRPEFKVKQHFTIRY